MTALKCNEELIQAHSIKTEPELALGYENVHIQALQMNYSVSKAEVKVESSEDLHCHGDVNIGAQSLVYQKFNYEEKIQDEYDCKSQEIDNSYEALYQEQTSYEYIEPEENFISVDDLKVGVPFPSHKKGHLKDEAQDRQIPSLLKNDESIDNVDEIDYDEDDVIFLDDDDNINENECGVEVEWLDLENGKLEFECFLCNKKVASNYNLRRHMMIHTGERPFGCDICLKKFREFSDLKKHRRVHVDDEGFKCLVCHRNTPSEKNATKCDSCSQQETQHKIPYGSIYLDEAKIREATHKKAFVCPVCDRIFGSRHNLKRHYMIHTGEKPYKCDLCEKRFREVSTMKKHALTHSRINVFNCAICGAQFNDFRIYSRHKNVHLNKNKESNSQRLPLDYLDKEEVIEYLFECRDCTEKFPNVASYKEHLKIHARDETFQCPICGIIYRTKEKLQAHFITHDSTSEGDSNANYAHSDSHGKHIQ